MKNLHITLVNNLTAETVKADVKSICAMHNWLRAYRNATTHDAVTAGIRAQIVDDEGKLIWDTTFRLNKKGKIEMPNVVEESKRKRKEVVKTDVEATIDSIIDEIGCNTDDSDIPEEATEFDPESFEKVS